MILISAVTLAQQKKIDSLKKILAVQKEDTAKVYLLEKLGKGYMYMRPDSTIHLAQQGILFSRKLHFIKGEIFCLIMEGNGNETTGNYPKALAIELQALKLSEETGDIKQTGSALLDIGNVYSDQGDFRKSLINYIQSAKIARNTRFDLLLEKSLGNIGDSYENLNQLDSARKYTQQAYEMSLNLKDTQIIGISVSNLGNIYAKMGQPNIAMDYYRQSIPDLKRAGFNEAICEVTLGMARLFTKSGKTDSALYYGHTSIAMAKSSGLPRSVLNAALFMTQYYKARNSIDSAFVYQDMIITAKDSLYSQEKDKELQSMSFEEANRQQDLTMVTEANAESRKKNIQMAGVGAFIPLFFGILLLFSKRTAKPRTIEFLGLLGLLLLFEFLTLLLHPYIEKLTHDTPLVMLMILVAIASLLVPLHHKLEGLLKLKLAHPVVKRYG